VRLWNAQLTNVCSPPNSNLTPNAFFTLHFLYLFYTTRSEQPTDPQKLVAIPTMLWVSLPQVLCFIAVCLMPYPDASPASKPSPPLVQIQITDLGLKQSSDGSHRPSPALHLDLTLSAAEIIRANTERQQQLRGIAKIIRRFKQGSPFERVPAELHLAVAEHLDGPTFSAMRTVAKPQPSSSKIDSLHVP